MKKPPNTSKAGALIWLIRKTDFIIEHQVAEYDQKQSLDINTCLGYEKHQKVH